MAKAAGQVDPVYLGWPNDRLLLLPRLVVQSDLIDHPREPLDIDGEADGSRRGAPDCRGRGRPQRPEEAVVPPAHCDLTCLTT